MRLVSMRTMELLFWAFVKVFMDIIRLWRKKIKAAQNPRNPCNLRKSAIQTYIWAYPISANNFQTYGESVTVSRVEFACA